MLQIKQISKVYHTGSFIQTALSNVNLTLRNNEFVAILGPSGSGKTTLLNILGGLDRYDSGDLLINGISTKEYKDRDWDAYRNHRVGFVFQSYNLIGHQTILANIELAMTISGVSKAERRERAMNALTQVGLKEHCNKKPNQLSGGQMQRVAIARALVNDPDILLADEPTGALDSDTSLQIMNLLSSVARDRLVVMVTHNPDLAENYASRIIKLKDGHIFYDSNPIEADEPSKVLDETPYTKPKKTSMSFGTSLSLSYNNLKTKKARTALTAFAGSIGIIGIALILALSNGVNTYIDDIQKETMTSYPITIEAETMDLSSMLDASPTTNGEGDTTSDHAEDGVYVDTDALNRASSMASSMTENNLSSFMEYLEDDTQDIHQYIGENGIVYSYDTKFNVYSYDSENTLVSDTSEMTSGSATDSGNFSMTISSMSEATDSASADFSQLLPGAEDSLISSAITDSYEVVYGSWPSNYNEIVLVLDENNEISAASLYRLGLIPSSEYTQILEDVQNGEEVTLSTEKLSFEEISEHTLYLVPAADLYEENGDTLISIAANDDKIKDKLQSSIELKITAIVKPSKDAESTLISTAIGYTKALTDYIISYTNDSSIVKSHASNDDNLALLGAVDKSAPSAINIYTDSFENKEAVTDCIEEYNKTASEKNKITYTDYVALLMSSITTIINVITYILIAFVAVSLIVSSIMIGIITYISVLERTKEIGILRSIGASKRNISQVFTAETMIIGLCSGVMGIIITLLLQIPVNSIIHSIVGTSDVNAVLPSASAFALILLSILLTLIGGFIPAKKAAKKDPVAALRTE